MKDIKMSGVKRRINEFINTMDYMPVLTIGQFMDSFIDGLKRDRCERLNEPVFVRTLTATLKGDGSKSLFQRWKDMSSAIRFWDRNAWYFPVLDVRFENGEIRLVIDSKNFAGGKKRLDKGLGPQNIWDKLALLRDEGRININTKVVVYDKNTGKTLWIYKLRQGYYSRKLGFGDMLRKADSECRTIPNIFDPALWFDTNNYAGINQSLGIGAETPKWFLELKRRSDAKEAPFGHQLSPTARQRFRDAGLGESNRK